MSIRRLLHRIRQTGLRRESDQTRAPTDGEEVNANQLGSAFRELRVKHGVFCGMRYPEMRAVGSEIYPKLLGYYESELADIVACAPSRGFMDVVNIGCGEGYYAIGLARSLPFATVYAFDTDPTALRLCRRMAILNGVSDRVVTATVCDPATMLSLRFSGRAFVVSDCEGYERALFTPAVVERLRSDDVLIEVHDFIDPRTSSQMRARFQPTHVLRVIDSVDASVKLAARVERELESFDRSIQMALVDERRPGPMQWFYFTPRVADGAPAGSSRLQ